MNFVSWAFAALFLVVFAARLTIGRRKIEPAYVAVLIVASLVFYGWHVPAYLPVLMSSALVDFLVARAMGRLAPAQPGRRRALLIVSLAANLGLLAFFKYGDFATHAAEDLGALLGRAWRLPEANLVLPMGISFYTFQTLSYTIDVYRGTLTPLRSFWRFLLFISFFPQLVAGPIVRASEFLPQLPRPRRLRLRVFYEGAWLIIAGLFMKMVCADNLAAYVDEYWSRGAAPGTDATFSLWLALMFSGQIFADFCGYSTIARGLGYLLGFRFPVNFNAPYIAATFKAFWERWHITLSRWLRDYLYVPLGGNRGPRLRTYVNLLLVMLLGGLWHGAAYTFIVWGAIHGLCLALERALRFHRRDGAPRPAWLRGAWAVFVQGAVLVAWIYFRSDTLDDASRFVANLAFGPWTAPAPWMAASLLFLSPLVGLHAYAWLLERRTIAPLGAGAKAALAAGMAYGILTLYGSTSDFIYFQF
ncbi:MAG TPA: MBOAT family O-acyltransferase [Vicinamibacterales bacterium]|nr:MBOAT family O-acyltransferase [Vicinamibacterales bacterium]